ncbi:MAG: ABC-2 family transporter protein [Chloroflexi bacterium]|nr:ABC-2 family transporter protein [Chloroflexota bacterium]
MIGDLWALYRACFQMTIAGQLQYRLSLVIWLLGLVIQPVIYLVVWQTVAAGGSVAGYTAGDFAAYYLVLMLVNHATFTWIMHEFDFEIRHGFLSGKLLKPVNPIHFHLVDNLTYKLLTLIVVGPAALVLALYFRPTLNPSLEQVGLFAVALVLAIALRWVVEYIVALAAFWTTRVNSVNSLYFTVLWFMAGLVAPNALLPGLLQQLARVLPFRYMVAFPIEVLLGRISGGAALEGYLAQVVWLGLALGIYALVWRAGLRRYSAVGA